MSKVLSAILVIAITISNGINISAESKGSMTKGATTEFSLFDVYNISQLALDSNENFETFAAGTDATAAGFAEVNQNAVASVVDLEGNRCVRFTSVSETAGTLTWNTRQRLSGKVLMEYDVMIPHNLYYSQIPMIEGYNSDGNKVFAVTTYVTSPAKYLMIGMSSIGKIDMPLEAWIRMGYEIDIDNKTVSVYIDGKQVADNEAIFNVVESISSMYFSVKTPGDTLYIDNIKIGSAKNTASKTAEDPRPNLAYPKEMLAFTSEEKETQRIEGEKLVKNIQNAYRAGEKEITIEDGYYRLYNPISLDGFEDFEIKGNDVNIIMEKTGLALSINECKKVKVSGLRIDYEPLSFTQGRVTYVDREAKKFAIKLDNGYPELNAGWAWNRIIPYEPDGNTILSIQHNDRLVTAESLGNKEYLIGMSGDSFFAEDVPLRLGCIIVISNRKGDGAVRLSETENCTLENVSVYSSPGFAVTDSDGYGDNKFINMKIIPRPGTNRYLSSSADGFHTFNKVKGPTIDRCEISHVEDDIMNLNASCNYIFDVIDSRTIRVVANRILCAEVGEKIKIFDFESLEIKGEPTVVSTTPVGDTRYLEMVADMPAFMRSEYGKNSNTLSTGTYSIYDVTLDQDVDALPYDVLTSDSRACTGTRIMNSYFHHGFVRGISLRSPQTIIENCTFDTICNAAIDIEMYQFWLEGPCATDVIIRNNTFNNCVYGATLDTSLIATIQTLTPRYDTDGNKEPYNVYHYRNIEIYENVFTGSRACSVALINAVDSTVRNNKVSYVFTDPYKQEKRLPNYMKLEGFYSAILAEYSKNVTIEDNEVSNYPDWCVPVTNLSQ